VVTSVESLNGVRYIGCMSETAGDMDLDADPAIRRYERLLRDREIWGNVSMRDRDADKDVLLRYPEKGLMSTNFRRLIAGVHRPV
jgi:hypothetical protein